MAQVITPAADDSGTGMFTGGQLVSYSSGYSYNPGYGCLCAKVSPDSDNAPLSPVTRNKIDLSLETGITPVIGIPTVIKEKNT